jgi:hypothetical protein
MELLQLFQSWRRFGTDQWVAPSRNLGLSDRIPMGFQESAKPVPAGRMGRPWMRRVAENAESIKKPALGISPRIERALSVALYGPPLTVTSLAQR